MTALLPLERTIVTEARSLKEAAIRIMAHRGYQLVDGVLLNPAGKPMATTPHWRGGHPQTTIQVEKKRVRVSLYRFAAFCTFGDAIFTPGIQVRHLGGVRDFDKLALGTQTENEADKPPEVRSRAAGIASRTYWERRRAGMLPA